MHDSAFGSSAEMRGGAVTRSRGCRLGGRIESGAADSGDRAARLEFLEAGTDVREKLEAAVVAAEIDRAYLEWGLAGSRGWRSTARRRRR